MAARRASLCRTPILVWNFLALLVASCVVTATAQQPVSFQLDVQPILAASGCNTGACHGKQRGQNGFQLSLLGFDSDFDFHSLTQDTRGRRIFPAVPSQSLLLRKATAEVPHGGGRRFTTDSNSYQTLHQWIRQGTPRSVPDEPSLEKVELKQTDFALTPKQSQALQVAAYYSDGTTRDVTGLTSYLSNDNAIAKADPGGNDFGWSLAG